MGALFGTQEDLMWFKTVKSNGESAHAIEEAKKHLEEIEKRGPEVRELTKDIHFYRARNHFGEHVDALVKRRIERGRNDA